LFLNDDEMSDFIKKKNMSNPEIKGMLADIKQILQEVKKQKELGGVRGFAESSINGGALSDYDSTSIK